MSERQPDGVGRHFKTGLPTGSKPDISSERSRGCKYGTGSPSISRQSKNTEEDYELQELIKVILTGWPEDKSQVRNSVVPYFNVHDELTVQNGVIF